MTPFSPDYFAARERFRRAADRLGWEVRSHPIDARGPGGEELTIDVASSPGPANRPLLLVTGGVHGVEGFVGSAVQVAALERWAAAGVPAGVRFVFAHALCPFGFAHVRRFDETNTDLNRNFLLPGEAYAGSPPTYAELDRYLNPRRPPSRVELFTLRALYSILVHGQAALKQAIAGGQYEFPKGLFFGGPGPARANLIVRDQFAGWLGDSPTVIHLDFHTGLGRWATYKLLIDAPLTADQLDRAASWFGRDTLEACDPAAGVAYRARGGFDVWCHAQAAGRDFITLCAEFGTYWNVNVLAGVRAENMAHHWGHGPDDPRTRRAKADLLELFCPASSGWREPVVRQSLDLIDRAVAGLADRRQAGG